MLLPRSLERRLFFTKRRNFFLRLGANKEGGRILVKEGNIDAALQLRVRKKGPPHRGPGFFHEDIKTSKAVGVEEK